MHFGNINITGFRGIKDIELEDCQLINLIVGKNNSCKTSILEAIFLLVGISNAELVIRINNFRDLIITEESDFRFIFHNLDYFNDLKIKTTRGKNAFRELQIKPVLKENDNLKSKSLISSSEIKNEQLLYDSSSGSSSISTSSTAIKELSFKFKIKEFHSSTSNFEAKLKLEGNNVNFQKPKGYSEKLRGVYTTQRILFSRNLEKELEELVINKRLNEILEVLHIIDDRITDISFGSNGMVYFDIGISRLVPLNLTGDGVRRLLSIILALYNAKDGLLFIDEIENGLHFSVLESFWKVIYKAATKFNVQVFATTHNIESLKYLSKAGQNSGVDFQKALRSYTIRRTKDDGLKAIMYDFEKFSFSINQGIEMR